MRENDYLDKPYELNFSINRRIEALAGHHRYIEWTFASFNEAIQAYGIDAIETLNSVLESLIHIRNKLITAGATDKQLEIYDNKVCVCFGLVLSTIKNRINSDDNTYTPQDVELLNSIKDYDIYNYHNGCLKNI